ncbi:integral membrane protein [Histoplasma ohiense]|nr:integral membrane protein [Histoplasma ohiense (nom. inval.)]
MPIFSRLISVILRIGEIGCAAVVAGIIGHDLARFDDADSFPNGRWIYTIIVAGISILLGIIWLIPFSQSFTLWIGDLLLSFAWFAAFGVLVDVLKKMNCGRTFDWGHITDGGVCSRWKAVEAFSFVSAILWLVSTIVGVWFTHRTRDRHPVAAGGPSTRRGFWGRRHAV